MVAEIIEGAVARLGAAGMERELAVEALVRLLVLADVELEIGRETSLGLGDLVGDELRDAHLGLDLRG